MKNMTNIKVLFIALLITTCFYACKKSYNNNNNNNTSLFSFTQTNIVADNSSFGAAVVDTNLVNAWGISVSPSGAIWISSNAKGRSTIYDKTGKILLAAVTVPTVVTGHPGSPTGQVFNSTADFGANKFIFASIDGTISAWASGTLAVKVADRSTFGAEYTGLAMGVNGGANFLYAANFKGNKIDVFDKNFAFVSGSAFTDPGIPAGFAPFNIQNIGGQLYVTYAKQLAPANTFDQPGAGNGYVDIFNVDGTFVKRFASQGTLNSPWGIAVAPAGFADAQATILVGNFGDGRINVYDMQGNYKNQLQKQGQVLVIDGLWAVDFLKGNVVANESATDALYFTAGPSAGTHGLFGSLVKQ